MASNNVILDMIRKEESSAIRDLIGAIKLISQDSQNENVKKLLSHAEQSIGTGRKEKRQMCKVVFTIPDDSLESWCKKLRAKKIKPANKVHFKESDRCAYKNTNEDSYTVDLTDVQSLAEYDYRDKNKGEEKSAEITEAKRLAKDTAEQQNVKAVRQNPDWVLLKRDSENDTRTEDSLIRFLSDKNPDWFATIENVKNFGERVGYDERHYKTCLDRLVSYYTPKIRVITEKMVANDLATFLSNQTMPESEFEVIDSQIKQLVRQPGDKIRSTMSHLLALAQMLHKDATEPEKSLLIHKMMIIGLANFTIGETNANLQSAMEHCKLYNQTVSWEQLLEGVVQSEIRHGVPNVPLSLTSTATPSVMTFNVDTKVNTMVEGIPPLVQTGLDLSWPEKSRFHDYSDQLMYTSAPQNVLQQVQNHADSSSERREPVTQSSEAASTAAKIVVESLINELTTPDHSPEKFSDATSETPVEKVPEKQVEPRRTTRQGTKPDKYASVHNIDFGKGVIDILAARIAETIRNRSRTKSRDSKKSRSKSRSRSRDKKAKANVAVPTKSPSRDSSRGRDSSKKSNYNSRNSNDRSRSRERPKSEPRDSSRNSRNPRYRSNSRDGRNNRSKSWSTKEMEKGNNCSVDYDPTKEKRCLKCLTENLHHEFQCEQFFRRSKFNCRNCNKGFHWQEECKYTPPDAGRNIQHSQRGGN
jgi:hypothetical protein